jgi:DNA polymerase
VSAAEFLPEERTLPALREAAAACRGCPLWQHATQTVFGEGSETARVVFVGEKPGHEEDLAGRPFVGPAGRLLDDGLGHAGIDRRDVYVTNVVKHFKYVQRGKRRIHQKPTAYEIDACRPWLEAELQAIRPRILVALGATAARALFGSKFRVTRERGVLFPSPWAELATATMHPSAILRIPEDDLRRAERARLFDDLAAIGRALRGRTYAVPPSP